MPNLRGPSQPLTEENPNERAGYQWAFESGQAALAKIPPHSGGGAERRRPGQRRRGRRWRGRRRWCRRGPDNGAPHPAPRQGGRCRRAHQPGQRAAAGAAFRQHERRRSRAYRPTHQQILGPVAPATFGELHGVDAGGSAGPYRCTAVEILGAFVERVLGTDGRVPAPAGSPNVVLFRARQPGRALLDLAVGDP
jgi:hypothetical protein